MSSSASDKIDQAVNFDPLQKDKFDRVLYIYYHSLKKIETWGGVFIIYTGGSVYTTQAVCVYLQYKGSVYMLYKGGGREYILQGGGALENSDVARPVPLGRDRSG